MKFRIRNSLLLIDIMDWRMLTILDGKLDADWCIRPLIEDIEFLLWRDRILIGEDYVL